MFLVIYLKRKKKKKNQIKMQLLIIFFFVFVSVVFSEHFFLYPKGNFSLIYVFFVFFLMFSHASVKPCWQAELQDLQQREIEAFQTHKHTQSLR